METTEKTTPITYLPTLHHLVKDFSRVRYKTYSFDVTSSGQVVNQDIRIDQDIQRVLAIKVSSNRPDMAYFRGLLGIKLNQREVFEENFEARNLIAGPEVAPDASFTTIDREAGSGNLVLRYTDENNPALAFPVGGYKVRVCLMCLTDDTV
jgi:hypothetical protein